MEMSESRGNSSKKHSQNKETSRGKSGPQNSNTCADSHGVFPDLSTVDWYLDPRFQRYWKHYHHVMNWYQKHLDTYQMLTSRLNPSTSSQARNSSPNLTRFNPYDALHRSAMSSQSQRSNTPQQHTGPGAPWSAYKGSSHRKTERDKTQSKKNSPPRATSTSSCSDTQTDRLADHQCDADPHDFEMEITDEMVEFFATSRKHRKERDEARRTGNGSSGEEEHVDVEKASKKKTATTKAPKERPGVRRTQEMKQLYGKGAAMIHGMETAIQMTFDRNTDLKQPKLWPNMPLKIVFN